LKVDLPGLLALIQGSEVEDSDWRAAILSAQTKPGVTEGQDGVTPERVDLTMELASYDHPGPQSWRITCHDTYDALIHLDEGGDLQLRTDHPLLWRFTMPELELYFRRLDQTNAVAALGAIYATHMRLTNGWLELGDLLNANVAVETLLSGVAGLLATGPKRLIEAFSAELAEHGYEPSTIAREHRRSVALSSGAFAVRTFDPDCAALTIGSSYVVGRLFSAERSA
jgi:hypothetical protein